MKIDFLLPAQMIGLAAIANKSEWKLNWIGRKQLETKHIGH
jgi:hypothetical protein